MRPGRRGTEGGSAAVLAAVLVGLLAVLAVLVAAVGGVVADQRRVASAVDLAALAAAAALQRGADACVTARSTAQRNGASVVTCRVDGDVVTLRAVRPATLVLGRTIEVSSRARAGPAGLD